MYLYWLVLGAKIVPLASEFRNGFSNGGSACSGVPPTCATSGRFPGLSKHQTPPRTSLLSKRKIRSK